MQGISKDYDFVKSHCVSNPIMKLGYIERKYKQHDISPRISKTC